MVALDTPTGWRGPLSVSGAEIVLATFALMVIELAIPIITLQVYNRVLPNQSYGTLYVLLGVGLVCICVDFALRYARRSVISMHGFAYAHEATCGAVRALMKADTITLPLRDKSLMNRLSSIRSLRDTRSGADLVVFLELVSVPAILVTIAFIAGPLVALHLIALAVFIMLSIRNSKSMGEAYAVRAKHDAERYDFLVETLEASHTLKALGAENRVLRKYEALKGDSSRANFTAALATTRVFDLSGSTTNFIMLGSVVFGALLVLEGAMSAGGLIAVILLSGRLMPPIRRALAFAARRPTVEAAQADLDFLLGAPPLSDAQDASSASTAEKVENAGRLSVRGVSFAYPDGQPLFDNVSLDLKLGECASISTTAGGGATTLLNIVAGIQGADAGEVLLNDKSVLHFQPRELAKHVGYIRTRPAIYRGTIRDNLTRFGEAPFEDVTYVAKLLGVDRDVAQLPAGYETQLNGDESDPIPPGLKQRIGIVRCLALRPRLIIFDNADVSLDRESYELVYRLFERLRRKTTLLICSSDGFLQNLADRRYEIADRTLRQIDTDNGRGGSRGKTGATPRVVRS